MKKLTLLVLLLSAILFFQPISAAIAVSLLISEQFPQIPVKPLGILTNNPKHEQVRIGDGIIADLFLPNRTKKGPAVILAMGVRTNEKDKPILLGFANNMARLGYVVMWSRLEALDKEEIKFERPQTFIDSFQYLQKRVEVDKERISFIGFSVGSSIAMVAVEDESINTKLRSLVFFGGYFNSLDYFISLATKSMLLDGQKILWQPHQDGINHANGILEKEGLKLEQFTGRRLSDTDTQKVLKFSPDQNIKNFRAPVFILHEKGDNFVPYVESVKLKNTLLGIGKPAKAFHLANLFEHVQPKKEFSFELLKEFVGLFGFLYKVFRFL